MTRLTASLAILAFAATSASAQTTPSAAMAGAGFGGVAAVGNGEIFVGSAPVGWQSGNEPPGTVYRYVRNDADEWVEASGVMASEGVVGDHFGRTVVHHAGSAGEMLIVGAPGIGAAYVFEKQSGTWTETGKLTPSSLTGVAEFGGAYARAGYRTNNIAVVGDRIAVTAYGTEAANNAVHIFAKSGDTWTEEVVLQHPDESFGFAIVASDHALFVAAPAANDRRGAVHAFVPGPDGWSQAGSVAPDDTLGERASFGQGIAFDNNKLYVGAPFQNGSGTVFTFDRDGTGEPAQTRSITQPAPAEGERAAFGFGGSLAASGGTILIGARGGAFAFNESMPDAGLMQITAPDDRARRGFGAGLAISGTTAVIGSPSADYEEGISTVFEYTTAMGESEPAWHPVSTLASEISYLSSISGDQIDCEDGTADQFACQNVDLVSFLSAEELRNERGVKMTDLWGWTDPETGKEWVILGRTDGTAFVDISDPSHPVYVGQLLRTEGSPGSTWRDIKVYKNHAFIVADGAAEHGVQVYDLTQLRSVAPADMPATFKETTIYRGTTSTHNIVINEETGFAYAVGNDSSENNPCGGQLHIFDIRDPANPKFAGCFTTGQGGTHDAQCVIYRGADTDYTGREICLASNGSSFVIADVTDKDSTKTIANTSYPNQAYTHQGWLSEDHNYFYMNDELDEMNGLVDRTRTLIWDVTDLDDPQLANEFALDSGASDHNLYIRDNFLYESNYQAGLRILDISDPVNPVEVGHFDTAPFAEDAAGFGGSWSNYPYFESGVIAVSSQAEGLFLLRKREVGS